MDEPSDRIRFLLDEDVALSLAEALCRRGVDAIHVAELGRRGLSDEDQLAFAVAGKRVLITHNRNDFLRLAREWWETGRHHPGIVYARHAPPGELLRRVLALVEAISESNLRDAVVPLEAFG